MSQKTLEEFGAYRFRGRPPSDLASLEANVGSPAAQGGRARLATIREEEIGYD